MNDKSLKSIYEKAINGFNQEGSDLDFKRQWWDLTDHEKFDEFLKDLGSMSNNKGGNSNIILGMDEDGKLYDAPLPLDEAILQQKISGKFDPAIKVIFQEFELENKKISVITLPHSPNRPHYIKKYKNTLNRVLIKIGSSTGDPSRADLDEMYAEREQKASAALKIEVSGDPIIWQNNVMFGSSYAIKLTFDNSLGTAPEYIKMVALKELSNEHWESKFYKFDDARKVNAEYEIPAYKRVTDVVFYVSHLPPNNIRDVVPRPNIDTDQMKIIVTTVNSGTFVLDTESGWF